MSSSPLTSPASSINPAQSSQPKTKKEKLEDALSKPFNDFDAESMACAYDEESVKMAEFETELSEMLLAAMLDVRAWALARPVVEHENARVELSNKLREIEKIQEEQEHTRMKLLNFIRSIKSALAALTAAAAVI